jgi:type II secretory pathway pseudopilin PulG
MNRSSSPHRSPPRRRDSESGFTLLGTLVAGIVLTVSLAGLLSAILSSMQLRSANRETVIASNAAQDMVEALRRESFDTLFVRFNADRGDDPGPNPAPGNAFTVPELASQEGDADGMVGEIVFPTFANAPGILREDVQIPSLGMPRDLNFDGQVDNNDHTPGHSFLPVLIRMRWNGTGGNREMSLATVISGA